MTFDEYVSEWWSKYIESHQDDFKNNLGEIFTQLGYNKEEYLEEGQTVTDFLSGLDAGTVYEDILSCDRKIDKWIEDIPATEDFLTDVFTKVVEEIYNTYWSFADDFIADMAYHSQEYASPISFFTDLSYGGCMSGMIGMLIYNDDCKKIYIENIDDMQGFLEEEEEEIGGPIYNKQHLPHYTFMCWFCYEELGYAIARALFPNEF